MFKLSNAKKGHITITKPKSQIVLSAQTIDNCVRSGLSSSSPDNSVILTNKGQTFHRNEIMDKQGNRQINRQNDGQTEN